MNDALKNMTKLLLATGAIPCVMVLIYRATPILLEAFPDTVRLSVGLLFTLLFFAFVFVIEVFVLRWLFAVLQDKIFYLGHRQRMEMMDEHARENRMNNSQPPPQQRTRSTTYRHYPFDN